jgi:drug/metabolite transporter (DMT)-like permease
MQSISAGGWLVAGAGVLWGTTGLIARISPTDAGPAVLGQARLLIGGLVLGLACSVRSPGRSVATVDRAGLILRVVCARALSMDLLPPRLAVA